MRQFKYGTEIYEGVMMSAMELFTQKGFSDCELKDVFEAAQVSSERGAPYFETKEELFNAVVNKLIIGSAFEFAGILKDDRGSAKERLEAALTQIAADAKKTDLISKGADTSVAHIKRHILTNVDACVELCQAFQKWIEDGVQEGALKIKNPSCAANFMAFGLLGLRYAHCSESAKAAAAREYLLYMAQ